VCIPLLTVNITSIKVRHNGKFMFEIFATRTTTKVFDIWLWHNMTSQFSCCTETHWTFTANIRLHSFMTKYMFLKVTTMAKFSLTNITCQPTSFIMWLQQMCLELIKPSKTVWRVSTWVWLCSSVNTNMKLQFSTYLKQLAAVRTVQMSHGFLLLCTQRLCVCK